MSREGTFERRGTAVPSDIPEALTTEFAYRSDKQIQWTAFLRRTDLQSTTMGLDVVTVRLRHFLIPPAVAVRDGGEFLLQWNPDGCWKHAVR